MKRTILLGVTLGLLSNISVAKDLYRASTLGDKGTYYVLETKKLQDSTIQVLTSRIGPGNAYTDFTELKINCQTQKFFELAGGEEDGAKDKPTKPLKDLSTNSKWTSLVIGSSKHDLVEYVCNKK